MSTPCLCEEASTVRASHYCHLLSLFRFLFFFHRRSVDTVSISGRLMCCVTITFASESSEVLGLTSSCTNNALQQQLFIFSVPISLCIHAIKKTRTNLCDSCSSTVLLHNKPERCTFRSLPLALLENGILNLCGEHRWLTTDTTMSSHFLSASKRATLNRSSEPRGQDEDEDKIGQKLS